MNAPATAPAQGLVPGSPAAWLLAMRPATLTAALAPVAVGTAIAEHEGAVSWGPAGATLLGATLLQVGSNFANDVFDFEKGADTAERLGPTRAVQAGLISPRDMRRAMWLTFALALLVGGYLTTVAGPAIVVIGLLSILSAIAYTGGPYPLGYHGLGDLFVLLFFGFVAVCGTAYVHLHAVPLLAWLAALVPGVLAANILQVNNVRDRVGDERAGKRTLAVRWGRRGAELQYVVQNVVAYAVPVGLLASGLIGWTVLLPLVSAPLAIRNTRELLHRDGRELNPTLARTAKLVFLHSALFALGIALDPVTP